MPGGSINDASVFLNFYVNGTDMPPNSAPAQFFPGIRRRVPAVVGTSPDYDPQPNPDDGTLVTQANLLAEVAQVTSGLINPQRCVFRDLCGLEQVIVQPVASAPGYEMVFLWCTDYPATQFPSDPIANLAGAQASDGAGRVFVLGANGQSDLVVAECVTRFREFLGDSLSQLTLQARTVAFSFELLGTVQQQVQQGAL